MMKDGFDSGTIRISRRSKQMIAIAALAAAVITICFLIMPASTTSVKSYCGHEQHQHDASCYSSERTLICGQDESKGHEHSDGCYETVKSLVCGLEEEEGVHQHDDSCYEEQQVLVCSKEESEGHTHTDACYEEGEADLVCGKKEHTHTLSCYSNPDADLETEAEWTKTFEDVDLDDKDKAANEKVIAIAKTQLGYAESTLNYQVLKDGETKKGITRYGQWYGDSYGDWCAMFCSFCIRYAGIEKADYPVDSNCDVWIQKFKKIEKDADKSKKNKKDKVKIYHSYDSSYVPKSGDLIFYDFDGDKVAEHIGFVYKVKDENDKIVIAPCDEKDKEVNDSLTWADDKDKLTVVTIEGNHNGKVEYVDRKADSDYILGFGEIPDTSDNTKKESAAKHKKVYEGSDFTVTARYTGEAKLPKDVKLQVEEIKEYSAEYQTYSDKVLEQAEKNLKKNQNAQLQFARFFDISFISDGKEVEPEADVDIKITYEEPIELTSSEKAQTVHFSGKKAELIETETAAVGEEAKDYEDAVDTFKFTADSFSVYGNTVILTTLTTSVNIIGADGGTETKPTYDAYIDPSEAVSGSETLEGNSNVNVSYASDAATSDIEKKFTGKSNDGLVLTDKSVVYGDDDYGAFESYADYTFGITLSALAQEYKLTEENQVPIPIDIVFVLDVSGSMEQTYQSKKKYEILVDAVNSAMKELMDKNPNNRAGIALFSSDGAKLLDLDHWTGAGTNNDQFIRYSSTGGGQNYGKITTVDGITGDKLGKQTGTFDGSLSSHAFVQSVGTFTQMGIAIGSKILEDNKDITCTQSVGTGEFKRDVTTQRQPVILLLSDGEPTHCTDKYNDVLNTSNNPRGYGSGSSGTDNNYGVLGYYTILTANYCKNKVTDHYNKTALMYTIGMGIDATGTGTGTNSSASGAHYKRAVLNPDATSVAALTDDAAKKATNNANTGEQLSALLKGTFTGKTVTLQTSNQTNYWPALTTLATQKNVPVISNPYSSGYSYADSAYFGNLNTSDLEDIFSKIIKAAGKSKSYGLLLQKRSSCMLEDAIGDGMELKSDPKLYYGGKVYTHTSSSTKDTGETDYDKVTSYVYKYTYEAKDGSGKIADLSNISVQVFKNSTTGAQMVKLVVPDSEMPVYSPGGDGEYDWYYESLPVRLIYQVGLTAESVTKIKKMGNGTLTFNTNKWTGGVAATSTIYPTDDNPYYDKLTGTYKDYSTDKDSNASNTEAASISAVRTTGDVTIGTETVNSQKVLSTLGNNGMLTFTAESTSLTVTKKWIDIAAEDIPDKIQLQLYQKSDNVAETKVGDPVDMTPDGDGNWEYTFDSLPGADSEGDPYSYRVEEITSGPWAVTYSSEAVSYDEDLGVITPIEMTNTSVAYNLPVTGGAGTIPMIVAGLLIIAAAIGIRRRYAR